MLGTTVLGNPPIYPNISRWIMANPTAPLFFLQGNLAGSQPLPTSFSYNQTGKYKIRVCNMKKQQKTCRYNILIPMDPMDHFFHFCHCPIFFAIKFSPSSRTPDSRPESGIWPWNKTRGVSTFWRPSPFTLLGCPGQEGTGLRQDQRNQWVISPQYMPFRSRLYLARTHLLAMESLPETSGWELETNKKRRTYCACKESWLNRVLQNSYCRMEDGEWL